MTAASLRFLHVASDHRPVRCRVAISLAFYHASIIFADVSGITSEVPDRKKNDAPLFPPLPPCTLPAPLPLESVNE